MGTGLAPYPVGLHFPMIALTAGKVCGSLFRLAGARLEDPAARLTCEPSARFPLYALEHRGQTLGVERPSAVHCAEIGLALK